MRPTKWPARGIGGPVIAMSALGFTAQAMAESPWGEVAALRPRDVSARSAAVLDQLERRAGAALAAVPRARSARDADAARAGLRERLEHSLGVGRLPWPPTLRPREVGRLQRDGYRIEKIVYESLPGSLVPAHLYVPDGLAAPAPAVLFYPGHWWADSKARPDFQSFCINMARLGFVVLNFDPFGQGERGVSARDHRRTEGLLVGVAQQGFAVYETRCALEYLLSRAEVDPRRIGMTGASGGGYNTWITAALDDRIAAAVPVVGTSAFFEQIQVCRSLDWYRAAEHCHFVPGLIRYADNHELLAMAAPKPLLIIAAARDESFPVAGARAVAEYGRGLYGSYGDASRIGLMVDEREGHGYQQAKREAAYGWFLRWLAQRGDGRPYPEPRTETLPPEDEALRCFPAGRNEGAGPAMIEAVHRLARTLPPSGTRIDLDTVLGAPPPAPAAWVEINGDRAQRLVVPTEAGLDAPAFLVRPGGAARGLLVALDDRGKEALAADAVAREAYSQGWAVCGMDPRGMGESASDKAGWVFAVSLLLGENFVGRQGWDIGRVIEALSAHDEFKGKPIGLYARGENASLAATYAIHRASQPGQAPLRWYLLRDGFLSYRAFLDRPRSMPASFRLLTEDRDRTTAYDREVPARFFPFGALRDFDLPGLLAASPAMGLVVNPRDGDWERLPEGNARAMLPDRVGVVSAEAPEEAINGFLQTVLVPGPNQAVSERLRGLDGRVLPGNGEPGTEPAEMLVREVGSRLREASLRESRAWSAVKGRAAWEAFREPRLHALREALGLAENAIAARRPPRVLVTRALEGDGYRIENLVYESRPGWVVTANLYQPAEPKAAMPGIVISHSHHNPKTQGELQDMGMTWARQGCLVLVPDHLGHGERRQHPFRTEQDFAGRFRVGRQDYYFRYVNGAQLDLAGESLMGWMVWDLMRGTDVLLSRPGIDKGRIILLGAVAGGGDPAAVTAALDARIQAVVPFNFGGTQPDYATPANPERDFYWFGVPYWEPTRALRRGAQDGFAHWVIVGSVAPRRVIFGQEFAWSPDEDPAWPRLRAIFDWYGVRDRLSAATGRGTLKGTPPESSHCNNIGPLHRGRLYPALLGAFAMPVPEEYSQRRESAKLLCLTPEAVATFEPRPLRELALEAGTRRAAIHDRRLAGMGPDARRRALGGSWARLLGDIEPTAEPTVIARRVERTAFATIERVALGAERGIVLPLILLLPPGRSGKPVPVVLGLAQGGKAGFLKERSEALAELLEHGIAVCLVDVRGTGETQPAGGGRRHNSAATALSASEWLLGQTLLGGRLRDVRTVLRHLRGHPDLDTKRVGLWGDSFAPTNPVGRNLAVPLDADPFPDQAEPLGGLLTLLVGLFEDDVRAVAVRGGLSSYASLLQAPYHYVPHDALVPGALTVGDLANVAAALAPRPLRLDRLVDGLNREVPPGALRDTFEPARASYAAVDAEARLQLVDQDESDGSPARWLARQLGTTEP